METRKAIPVKSGRVKRIDYEYRRNGVVNLFMMFEPLKARRHVKVMDQRTRKDFAECIRELVDVHYADAEKIVLVLDNLNTHSEGSLYEAFEPAEARRLAEKLEFMTERVVNICTKAIIGGKARYKKPCYYRNFRKNRLEEEFLDRAR